VNVGVHIGVDAEARPGLAEILGPMTEGLPSRYMKWLKREALGELAFWGELSRPPEDLPDYADWVPLLEDPGRRHADERSVAFEMTRGLLREVVYAAGGVGAEFQRLDSALVKAQEEAHESVGDPGEGSSMCFGPPAVEEAFYAFTNLLTWTRTVAERTVRQQRPPKRGLTGLLPSLAPGDLPDAVRDALDRLEVETGDARYLANYTLHAGALTGLSTPTALIMPGGRLFVRIPDRASGRVTTWQQFRSPKVERCRRLSMI